jgi:hypothetical protein
VKDNLYQEESIIKTVKEATATIRKLRRQLDIATEALQIYADDDDFGYSAREALNQIENEQ